MNEVKGITEGQLKQYRVIKTEMQRLVGELYEIYKKAYHSCGHRPTPETSRYGEEPRPSNKQPILWFADAIRRMEDKSQGLIDRIERLDKELVKYDGILLVLSEVEAEYVRLRYFEGMEHQEVARAMVYSKRGMDEVRTRALKKLKACAQTCKSVWYNDTIKIL